MTEHTKALLTVPEVARRLRCSQSQVFALIASGKLRCYRITTKKQGGIRIDEELHLVPFLKGTEPPAQPPEDFRYITPQ